MRPSMILGTRIANPTTGGIFISTTEYPRREANNDTPAPIRPRTIERRDEAARNLLVHRVVAEFREMPCLRLTPAQAQRLFGLRSDVSARIIGKLVEEGVLRLGPDGRYASGPRGQISIFDTPE